MSKESPLPPLKEEDLNEAEKKSVQAAKRSAEKLLKEKRALGHKLVIYKDGKVQTISP